MSSARNNYGVQKASGRRYYIGGKLTELLIRKTVGKKPGGERSIENKIINEIRRENRVTHSSKGDNAKLITKKINTLEKEGTLTRQEATKARQQIYSLITGRPGSDALRLLQKVQKPESPPNSEPMTKKQEPARQSQRLTPTNQKPSSISSIHKLQAAHKTTANPSKDAAKKSATRTQHLPVSRSTSFATINTEQHTAHDKDNPLRQPHQQEHEIETPKTSGETPVKVLQEPHLAPTQTHAINEESPTNAPDATPTINHLHPNDASAPTATEDPIADIDIG